jgi:hypothetical protein
VLAILSIIIESESTATEYPGVTGWILMPALRPPGGRPGLLVTHCREQDSSVTLD